MLFFYFAFFAGFSQDTSEIIDAFEDYSDLTREQVYVHLNKTTYITGEMLGFKAYVFLKDIKQPSTNTTNLYCQILDKDDKVLHEKLVMVNLGVSRGEFMIDSTYNSGEYTFKAYTKWSKNFTDEHNYFVEHFNVINPIDQADDRPMSITEMLDIQVLPESGHLLNQTQNVVGVIAKDQLGLGIPNLEVDILNRAGEIITSTQLNRFGIGQFLLKPISGEDYTLEYFYNEKKSSYNIPKAKDIGLLLSIQELPNKHSIALSLKTNDASYKVLGKNNYKLIIHNGSEANEAALTFNNSKVFTTVVEHSALFTGINIFTLFDDQNKPIAERLYFNYSGLPLTSINSSVIKAVKNDSIEIKLSIPTVNLEQLQSMSISILPSSTKSYKHHQNIISSIYLQPYLKSAVEEASYYFTDISEKKKYELDNLLLTQGWSSYDWTSIFNAPPEPVYDFEVGINYTINTNNSKAKSILIYPNVNTSSEVLSLSSNQKAFEKRGFFPIDDEKLRIGEVKPNGELGKSNVVLQFSPSKIIGFNTKYEPKSTLKARVYGTSEVEDFNEVQALNEVKLYAKRDYTRIEKLQNKSLGKIIDFGEKERQFYRTFAQFISEKGFYVEETPDRDPVTGGYSIFRIFNQHRVSINASNIPLIYFDNSLLVDLNILNNFSMRNVDYVEINRGGVGEGIRGGSGVIRIFTDPQKNFEFEPKISFTSYDIPLTYASPKHFYKPKYNSYNSTFFRQYGVIDWIPYVKVDSNGLMSFKTLSTNSPMTLYIEGYVNNEALISQQINIQN